VGIEPGLTYSILARYPLSYVARFPQVFLLMSFFLPSPFSIFNFCPCLLPSSGLVLNYFHFRLSLQFLHLQVLPSPPSVFRPGRQFLPSSGLALKLVPCSGLATNSFYLRPFPQRLPCSGLYPSIPSIFMPCPHFLPSSGLSVNSFLNSCYLRPRRQFLPTSGLTLSYFHLQVKA
jgi:hypothetical protein